MVHRLLAVRRTMAALAWLRLLLTWPIRADAYGPISPAAGTPTGGAVWAANSDALEVSRIDPARNRVATTMGLGGR